MLKVVLNGIEFKNPVLLASGILDETGETMLRVASSGAGGIVTKSIGMEPRGGYDNPVVYDFPHGMINAMGLPNPGIENYREEIKTALRSGVPIIGSIFGKSTEEYVYLAAKMEEYRVHAVELNLSCPHAKGYGMEIGLDTGLVEEIIGEVKRKVRIPVWAKITPNTDSVVRLAKAAEKADALVLINTVKAMAIDVDARKPVLSNIFGGLSGPCVKPIGVRAVYEVYREVEKPIIGVGGITTGRDALEYIMAGASLVQVGTAVYLRGIEVFRRISEEIEEWMRTNGFESLDDIIGIAQVR